MNYEEKKLVELANKYSFDVYSQEVINSVVADYTLVSTLNKSKIAILKRYDPNTKDVLELAGYRVMQTESIDFKKLEYIIQVFNRKDAVNGAQREPKEYKQHIYSQNSTQQFYDERATKEKDYAYNDPYWHSKRKPEPKYAAEGAEDRLYYTSKHQDVYMPNKPVALKKYAGFIVIIALVAMAIIFGGEETKAPNTDGEKNGLFDWVTMDMESYDTGTQGEQRVVTTFKNITYKPVTDINQTITVYDENENEFYKKSYKVSEALYPKKEIKTEYIVNVPTTGAYRIESSGYCKAQVI